MHSHFTYNHTPLTHETTTTGMETQIPTCESWVMTHDSSWNDNSWSMTRHEMTYSFVTWWWLHASHESWPMTRHEMTCHEMTYSFVTWWHIYSWFVHVSGGRVTNESRKNLHARHESWPMTHDSSWHDRIHSWRDNVSIRDLAVTREGESEMSHESIRHFMETHIYIYQIYI